MIVYLARNRSNGKAYVGVTIGALSRRWANHLRAALGGSHLSFHRAIKKYGADAFSVQVIEECSDVERLKLAEKHWIRELRTFDGEGYNLTRGGDGTWGLQHSSETRLKMSQAQIGKPKTRAHKQTLSVRLKGNKCARRRPVARIDENGNVVAIYETTYLAAQSVGKQAPGHIIRCCQGKQPSAHGYIWKYAADVSPVTVVISQKE